MWVNIISIIGAVLGATGLFGLIQFFVQRKDNRSDQYKTVISSLEDIQDELAEIRQSHELDKAINTRIRILHAADSIRHDNSIHSEEYFDQLNEDITFYENYCNQHQNFKNNKAVHAIAYINDIYRNALLNNNFVK